MSRKRARKSVSRPKGKTAPRPRSRQRGKGGFVGREASPVLDRYPPKSSPSEIRGPSPEAAPAAVASPPAAPAPAAGSPSPPLPLIALERPFDVDDFAQMLGETVIRVTVPREDLPEVLRRVSDFMGFGIYVYRISVRPAPSDLLKQFIVELQRVDYSPEQRDWVEFVERGRSESPFGPDGRR